MRRNKRKLEKLIGTLIFIIVITIGSYLNIGKENQTENSIENYQNSYETSNIQLHNGETYIEINNNIPKFTAEDMNLQEDYYSPLKDKKVRNGYDKNQLEKSK